MGSIFSLLNTSEMEVGFRSALQKKKKKKTNPKPDVFI